MSTLWEENKISRVLLCLSDTQLTLWQKLFHIILTPVLSLHLFLPVVRIYPGQPRQQGQNKKGNLRTLSFRNFNMHAYLKLGFSQAALFILLF